MGGPFDALKGLFRKGQPTAPCPYTGKLAVTVKRRDTGATIPVAFVTLSGGPGRLPPSPTDKNGVAKWEACRVGDYVVSVAFRGDNAKKYETPAPVARGPHVSKGKETAWEVLVDPIDRKLRLILLDPSDQPLAGRPWTLSSPVAGAGTTKADGLIEADLGTAGPIGALQVVLREPRPVPPPRPPRPRPAAYPPAIVSADFVDRDPVPPTSGLTVDWELTIADPTTPEWATSEGALRQRLHNLGFPIDGDGDPTATKVAVQAYQLHYQRNRRGSGKLADVAKDLRDRHDKP